MKLKIADYPQLSILAWNRRKDAMVEGAEALDLYESNWRHIEEDKLLPKEKKLIEELTKKFGKGVLNV
jgi:hypothetical protein